MSEIRPIRNTTLFFSLAAFIAQLANVSLAAGPSSVKNSNQKAVKAAASPAVQSQSGKSNKRLNQIAAVHAIQQHHKLGRGNLYVAGLNVKWIFNDGDVYFMYRGAERKVYLVCTSKKSLFEQPFAQFRRQGIQFTQGGQEKFESIRMRPAKSFDFQKIPVKSYTLLADARAGRNEIRPVEIGSMVALAEPARTPEMAEFVTLSYGLKKIDSVILELRMKFAMSDGSLWFKTSEKDLPKAGSASDAWLRTTRLEKTTVPGDFFDVPKDYKKVASQEAIMGMASAAKDFEDLLFAEPGKK